MAKKKCPTGTKVQTVILSKSRFDRTSAREWLGWYGMRKGLDEKTRTFRARQVDPGRFESGSLRTITLGSGVKAVIGCPSRK